MDVRKADWRGDGFYYTKEDLEWAVEPTNEDPGVTCPKAGAIPRDEHGNPVPLTCNGDCDPMCDWCNEQADIAADAIANGDYVKEW